MGSLLKIDCEQAETRRFVHVYIQIETWKYAGLDSIQISKQEIIQSEEEAAQPKCVDCSAGCLIFRNMFINCSKYHLFMTKRDS